MNNPKDFIQTELTETLGDFYENLNDGYVGSGINAISKMVDRNEDLIEKAGDVAGSVVGVGKDTFNLINQIVNKDDNPWDYIKTGMDIIKDLKLEKLPGLKGIPGLGIGIGIADLTVGAVAGAKNLLDDPDTNFVDWTKYGVDKVFDVLNMIPGLGIISSGLGIGMDFFLDGMSEIWNINKQNAEITRDNEANAKQVEYDNMVNRIRKEREDKMNAFYDKQSAEVHRQAVEAENKFKKSVHHEENSDIEALLFHREDELSSDQMNANYRKYASMVLSGQMKDINVNDINYMKGRYIDAPDGSGNKLSLHDFYVNNADGAIDYMREFNPRIYDDKEYKKYYDTFNLKNASIAEGMKYKPGALTDTGFYLNEADMQQTVANSYRPWDNSFMNK